MKLTSLWDAILGDKVKGYVPLDPSLNYVRAEKVRSDLAEMSPGYLLATHFEGGRWWLKVTRVGISRGAIHA